MSTRAVITIHSEWGDNEPMARIYHHYDGYPSYLGMRLLEYLKTGRLVNGLSGDGNLVWNGMGCLGADLVSELKDGPGGVYLMSPSEDVRDEKSWIEYEYEIVADDDAPNGVAVKCYDTYAKRYIPQGEWEES